jgi:hypothetical protein
MRTFFWGFLLVLLLPAVASAQGVELQDGQKVVAAFDEGGEVHHFRFHTLPGDTFRIKFKLPRGGELRPELRLVGPTGLYKLPSFEDGKVEILQVSLGQGGLHHFLVYAAGTEGKYSFRFKQHHVRPAMRRVLDGTTQDYWFPAGMKVKLELKVDKGYDQTLPRITRIVDPAGNDILDPSKTRESKRIARTKILKTPCHGIYTVHLDQGEKSGYLILKAKVRAAKPYTRRLTEKTVFESMVVGMHIPDSGTQQDYMLHAEALGSAVESAFVRYPESAKEEDVPLVEEDGDLRLDIPGMPPSGIYQLVVTLRTGKEVVKPFLVAGGWPAAPVVSVADDATSMPGISWTGGGGAEFFLIEIEEWNAGEGEWETKFVTIVPGNSTSYLPPEGPLDDVAHAVHVYGVHAALRGSYGGWIPD